MASDATTPMGNGLPNGSIGMVGRPVREMTYHRPTCDAFVAYMLSHGLDIDVGSATIVRDLGLVEAGGNGMGPYGGRVNKNERSKGSAYRLVLGRAAGTYRLIQLA